MRSWKLPLIIIAAILAVILLFVFAFQGVQNHAIGLEEQITTAQSEIKIQEKRRADLIPNLVNTVKGYAAHESETLESVIAARSAATSINLTADELTPEKIAEYQAAQQQVRSALGRLIAIAENYPDLKANQNFLELQAQLEGTENRIAVARKEFNEIARTYNVAVRRFPANLVAGICGFDTKAYFEADEAAAQAPVVQF